MQLTELVDYFLQLENTSSRNKMVEILANLFSQAQPEEIDKIIYLCQGRVAPMFEKIEFGVGEELVAETIAMASGTSKDMVKQIYKQKGDYGMVAEGLLPPKATNLSVGQVFDHLSALAQTSGHGAVAAKIGIMAGVLDQSTPRDNRFLIRIVLGRLRLGIGDPTMMDGLSFARAGDKSLRPYLERAYNLCSDLGYVAKLFWQGNVHALENITVQVGKPVRSALAERLPNPKAILAKIGKCAVEPKYDGFRCQVHKDGQRVKVFSRNQEDFSEMFPEIIEGTRRQIQHQQIIFEGEALAFDPSTGDFFPFQVTVQRKRKYGIEDAMSKLPLKLMTFDLLYLDGTDLTREPYLIRRGRLQQAIAPDNVLEVAEMLVSDDASAVEKFFLDKIQRGLEGVVCKRLDAIYQAGARNFNWIKLKRSYQGQISDTIDTIILGYWQGRGSRVRFGIGSLLTGIYDEEKDRIVTIARLGTGFTEEEWVTLKNTLDQIAVPHKPEKVESLITPDVWVEPSYVLAVQADEITRSPTHTCGLGTDEAKDVGFALRFPRAVAFIRADKGPRDATSVREIIEMFRMQGKQINNES